MELALNFAPTHCLVASLEELKRDRRHHSPLLGLLQDLSCHSSFPVRRYTATLLGVGGVTLFGCDIVTMSWVFLQVMVRGVEEKLVMNNVVPQLVRLARDSDK